MEVVNTIHKKSTTATNTVQTKRQPFFTKEGQGDFFANPNKNTTPFFYSNTSIQPKLTIGQPNDKYEIEADAMADKVIQRLNDSNNKDNSVNGDSFKLWQKKSVVQKKCNHCEQKEKLQKKEEINVQRKPIFESTIEKETAVQTKLDGMVQPKCTACEQEEKLQLKETQSLDSTPNLQHSLESSKGKGNSLPLGVQSSMGSAFSADFDKVKVHTGSDAIQMNKELGAQAFTHGNDIYFNQGKYDTSSNTGQHLLAHELTHTIQQGSSKSIQRKSYDTKADCETETSTSIKADKDTVAKDAMKLKISKSINGDPCACLIVIHNDEQNAMLTANLLHKYCSYNLILLDNKSWKDRKIILPNQGCSKIKWGKDKGKYQSNSHDPNSLFPKDIAQKYLYDPGDKGINKDLKKLENSKKKDEIETYTQMQFFRTVKEGSKSFALPVIALHNNSIDDTELYRNSSRSKSSFKGLDIDKTDEKKGATELDKLKEKLEKKFNAKTAGQLNKKGKTNIYRWCFSNDLVKCHIGLPSDPDKVVWVTNETDFDKMKKEKINVVLESSKLKSSKSESAGDLSTLFVILEKKIVEKSAKEKEEGLNDLEKRTKEIRMLLKGMGNINSMSDLGALPIDLMLSISKSIGIVFRALGLSATLAGRKSEINNLRYINIETPIDKIKDQTDAGRIESYEYIAEALEAVGLHCCGKDKKASKVNDANIKKELKVE
ncbi:eCIS core domain-containing protein [Aquimarina agarilytica]|uniref:eCIS core domain-containing protein n=1 Tax=Aquimarina agarilytica TaxID=1087449 RepID=UPI0002897A29|nr:DUF4157 domain-containing protein [Aquimarina agarilytica]